MSEYSSEVDLDKEYQYTCMTLQDTVEAEVDVSYNSAANVILDEVTNKQQIDRVDTVADVIDEVAHNIPGANEIDEIVPPQAAESNLESNHLGILESLIRNCYYGHGTNGISTIQDHVQLPFQTQIPPNTQLRPILQTKHIDSTFAINGAHGVVCELCANVYINKLYFDRHLPACLYLLMCMFGRCVCCGLKLLNIHQLLVHLHGHKRSNITPYYCIECGSNCHSELELCHHVLQEHVGVIKDWKYTGNFVANPCPFPCSFITRKGFQSLKSHMVLVHKDELAPHKCTYCGAGSWNEFLLAQHIKNYHYDDLRYTGANYEHTSSDSRGCNTMVTQQDNARNSANVPWNCKDCHKHFRNFKELHDHLNACTAKPPMVLGGGTWHTQGRSSSGPCHIPADCVPITTTEESQNVAYEASHSKEMSINNNNDRKFNRDFKTMEDLSNEYVYSVMGCLPNCININKDDNSKM